MLYAITIGGGQGNTAGRRFITIGGGHGNRSFGEFATIGGGSSNVASDKYSTVSGGRDNRVILPRAQAGVVPHSDFATIGGGEQNTANNIHATIAGGFKNTASGRAAAIGGGGDNEATAQSATISGGEDNTAEGPAATIGGGARNIANGILSTISGGQNNTANGQSAAIGGGFANEARATDSTIAGGVNNIASGVRSTIGGGGGVEEGGTFNHNTASGDLSTISGGSRNTARGTSSTVPGGESNTAAGDFSFAAGRRGQADHNGAFVWADSTNENFASTRDNQFLIRASGGVGIGTNNPEGALDVDGRVIADDVMERSSKRWKTNIQSIEGALDKVQGLRGVSYDWKADGKHDIGLIAEEVGKVIPEVVAYEENGKDATAVDYARLAPVLIEAIKEQQQIEDKDAQITTQQEQIAALQARMTTLEESVGVEAKEVQTRLLPFSASTMWVLVAGMGLLLATPGLVLGYRRIRRDE